MVLILLLLVTLPHFEYIPLWSSISILALSFWRVIIIFTNNKYNPSKTISVLLTILAVIIIYRYSQGFSGITAGSHLLVVMSFFKLLESKSNRDYMLLVILSFFIITTNFLFSQTLTVALYMFFCIFITLITLISINQHSSVISLTDKSSISLRLIGYSLPLMLVLFLFFPRITGPLWSTKNDPTQARSGLSDSMQPGQISQLVYSNDLVFRASFKITTPPQQQLYWRALTLWNFNGFKWTINSNNEETTTLQINSAGYEYSITLEPNNKKWLFLLDLPYLLSNDFKLNSDFTAQSPQPVSSLLQYTVNSSQDYRISSQLDNFSEHTALSIPGLNKRSIELALSWKKQAQTPEDIINSALNYFSKQGFYYTLSPARLSRTDAVDQFLFETREGFCEHYASAFAVLMRAAGIPSRIVLGYLGGNLNPINNVISVDQSMAHAWNEVWIDGKGWRRIDPTAAISPERVNSGIASALQNQKDLPLHFQLDFAALEKLRQLFDAIDNKWNQWVLSYDKNRQRNLLRWLTGKNFSLQDISSLFINLILGMLVLTSLFYLLNNKNRKVDPVSDTYRLFLKKMSKAGFAKAISEGPRDYKDRLISCLPDQQQEISFIIENYVNLKFRKDVNSKMASHFIRAVRQFNVKKPYKPSS
ncbi:MAG: DUF3488 and transglutaminase-like domain-containing protein [Gammaproteobacteria bacterium]|nr:DUF3488 and transglutaminase-like domain-containing protein [Gammaproteobacteria bacterium]